MITSMLFPLIGGLGFFFFGMKTMSEGLKNIAGNRLKNVLHSVTKNRVLGVMVGTFITILIQSSSATTVMVVGFVNAGMLVLKQAIFVIMGANIGTTFTAWLVSSMSVFNITSYALPAVGIGFLLMSLAKTRKNQSWGQVLLGFGILFIGLSFMKDAFLPLKDSEYVKDIFITFGNNPLLGVLVGIVFTVLLQSSSATIAIVQVLAFNGLISFEVAIPIILGDNIGTTITAQMAAIGTNINARRAAMSHSLFNVIGVAYMLIFVQIGLFEKVINYIIPGQITTTNIMFHIAVAHSTFNVVNMLVFLPFVSLLEKASIFLVPQKEDSIDFGTQYLEKHLLDTPSLALEQIHYENIYMLDISHKAVIHAVNSFFESSLKDVKKTIELETVTDNLQSEITQYIVELSQRNLLAEQSEELPVLIHNVNDIERIGDHAQNLAELTRRKIEESLDFSKNEEHEIKMMNEELEKMFEEAKYALKHFDIDTANRMLVRENTVNQLHEQFKQSHVLRLKQGDKNINAGFVYLEFIDNMEKIADRLTNIAQSVISKMKWRLKIKEDPSNQSD